MFAQGNTTPPAPRGFDMENEKLAARNFTQSATHIVEQLYARAVDRRMSSESTEQTVNQQGTPQQTASSTDVAISGSGFFAVCNTCGSPSTSVHSKLFLVP